MYSREMILDEIRRVAKNLGVSALKQKDFEEHSTIPLSTVKYYLGTWKGAIKDAGLSISGSLDVVKREDLLKELMRLYNEYGETPTPAMISDKGKFEIKLYEDKWQSLSQAFAEARKMKNLKTDNFATQEAPEVTPLAEEVFAEEVEPVEDSESVIPVKEEEPVESAPQELNEAYIVEEEPPVVEEPEEKEPAVAEEPAEEPPALEEKEEEPPPPDQETDKDEDDLEVTHESIEVTDKEVKKAQNVVAEEEKKKVEAEELETEEPKAEGAEKEKEADEKPEEKEPGAKKKEAKPVKESPPSDKEQDEEDIDLDDISFDEEEDVDFQEDEAEVDEDEAENILDKMEEDEHKTEEIGKKESAAKKRSEEVKVRSTQGEDESMNQKPKIRFIPQTVKPKKMTKKKTVLGEPINFRGLRYAPVNREGVIFLFGMVSQELGFVVESLRPDLPDCEGTRYVDEGGQKFERVRMCFCYKSSDFQEQDENLCDLIICWLHDWEDSPLEILELGDVIKYLSD